MSVLLPSAIRSRCTHMYGTTLLSPKEKETGTNIGAFLLSSVPCVQQQRNATPTGGPAVGSGGHGERGVGWARRGQWSRGRPISEGRVERQVVEGIGRTGGDFFCFSLQTRNFPSPCTCDEYCFISFHFHVRNRMV